MATPIITLIELLTNDSSAPFPNYEDYGSMTFKIDSYKGKGAIKMLVIWQVFGKTEIQSGSPPIGKDGINKFYYQNGTDLASGTPISQTWKAYVAADASTWETPISNVLTGTF